MIRLTNMMAMVVVVGAGVGIYQLKYNTERVQDEVRRLSAQIAADETAIKVLKAEWTYLARPERLESLSERYLALQPTAAAQVSQAIDEIPFRADPMTVVSAGDDFRAVAPQLVRAPAERPRPQPVPDVEMAEERILHVKHEDAPPPSPALTSVRQVADAPRQDLFTRIQMNLSEQPDGN